ncbi:hypothetical protein M0R04_12995 [Candidatus Dojkabacteria bacterium]|nr:hypothetical protein [Candidatus Dojkabacteria bacterium]
MAISFTKVNSFVEHLAEKEIDLSGAGLTLALSASAINTTATSISGVAQIGYGHLSTRVCTVSGSSQTAGTYKLLLTDLVLTADGTVPTWRYVALFDDASTSDRLIGLYDNGSTVTMTNTDTFTFNFDGSNGVLTIA